MYLHITIITSLSAVPELHVAEPGPEKPIFYWDFDDPREAPTDDENMVKIAVMKSNQDDESEDLIYLELEMRGSLQNVVIRWDDLYARTLSPDRETYLQADWDKGWFDFELWEMDGKPITSAAELDGTSPLTRCLARKQKLTGKKLEAEWNRYKALWLETYTQVIGTASQELKKANRPARDNFNRFFSPPADDPFEVGFYSGDGCELTEEDLAAAIAGCKQKMGVTPRLLTSDDVADGQDDWIKFSESPLGLYTTWVPKTTIGSLEDKQTGGGKWIREPPMRTQIEYFDKQLMEHEDQYYRKAYALTSIINTHLPLWKGIKYQKVRRATEAFMGESANKWALGPIDGGGPMDQGGLGWTGTNSNGVAAEWLHRTANSFEHPLKVPSGKPRHKFADRFSNIIFGTQECNTAMIRAETLVKRLNASKKVYQMLINTSSTCDPRFKAKNYYPRWLAIELRYEIIVQLRNADRSKFKGLSYFYPFSRRIPFRFEIELDKVLLDKYLEKVDISEQPGPNTEEDLLKGYELDYLDPDDILPDGSKRTRKRRAPSPEVAESAEWNGHNMISPATEPPASDNIAR